MTPIVRRFQQRVLVLLQRMTYMRINEEDSGEKEKECEGHRGWMTRGRAGMSSETAVARFFLDNGERDARLLLFNVIECSF